MRLVAQSLPLCNFNNKDVAFWAMHKSGKYTSASAKEALRENGDTVSWWKLEWFKGHRPKYAFIVWMVCKMKLLTKAN